MFGARVAFFPLRAATDTYSARAFEGHKLFQQVFGKRKILPTSPAVRVEKTCTDELQISLDDVIRSADVAGRIGTLIGEGYREGTFDFHIEDNAMSVAWNCTTSESR